MNGGIGLKLVTSDLHTVPGAPAGPGRVWKQRTDCGFGNSGEKFLGFRIFDCSPFWAFSRLQMDGLTLESQGSIEILNIEAERKSWGPETLAAVSLLGGSKHACTKVLLKGLSSWKEMQARHLQILYSKSAQFLKSCDRMFFLSLFLQAEFAKKQTWVLHASQCEELKAKIEQMDEHNIGPAFCKLAVEAIQLAKMLSDALPEDLKAKLEAQRKRWSGAALESLRTLQNKLEEDGDISILEPPEVNSIEGWELDPEVVKHSEWHHSCLEFSKIMGRFQGGDVNMEDLAKACMLVPMVGQNHLTMLQSQLHEMVESKKEEFEKKVEIVWKKIGKCRNLVSLVDMMRRVATGASSQPAKFQIMEKLPAKDLKDINEWYAAVSAVSPQEEGKKAKTIAKLTEILLVLQEWCAAPLHQLHVDATKCESFRGLMHKAMKFSIPFPEGFLTALL